MKESINKACKVDAYKVSTMYYALKAMWKNDVFSSGYHLDNTLASFKKEYKELAYKVLAPSSAIYDIIKAIDWAVRSFNYANCDEAFNFTSEIVSFNGNSIKYINYTCDSEKYTHNLIASLAPAFTLAVAYNVTRTKFIDINCGNSWVSLEDCSVYKKVINDNKLSVFDVYKYELLRNLNNCAKDKVFVLENILKLQCPILYGKLFNECQYHSLSLNELLSLYAYIIKTSFMSKEVSLAGLLERYVDQHPEFNTDLGNAVCFSAAFYNLPEVHTGIDKLDSLLTVLIKFNLISVNVTSLPLRNSDGKSVNKLTFTSIFNFKEKGLVYLDDFIYLSPSVVSLILSKDFPTLSLDSGKAVKHISKHPRFSFMGTSVDGLANVAFKFDHIVFESIVGAELSRTASLIYSSILVRNLKNIKVLLCTKDSGTLFINPEASVDIINRNKEVLNYVISNNYGRDAIDMYDDPITYIRKNIGSNNTSLVYYLVCLYLFEDLFKVFGAHFDTFMDSRGRFYYKGGIGHPQSFALARSAVMPKQPDAVINQQYDASKDTEQLENLFTDSYAKLKEMLNSSEDISIDCSNCLTSSKYQASFSYFDKVSNKYIDAPYLVGLKWLRDTLANYGIHDLDTL